MKQKIKRNYKIHNCYLCDEPGEIQWRVDDVLNQINESTNLKYIKTILVSGRYKDSIIIVYKEYF